MKVLGLHEEKIWSFIYLCYFHIMQRDPLYKCKSINGNLWFSVPENLFLRGQYKFTNPIHFTVGVICSRVKKKIILSWFAQV